MGASPLLHGAVPWLVDEAAIAQLVHEVGAAGWSGEGGRIAMPEGTELAAAHRRDAREAELLVAGVTPAELDTFADGLDAAPGQRVAVADMRVPGWRASQDVQCGAHMFHVYEPRWATFDESHQLAVVHPQYDGFLVCTVRAWRRIDDLRVVPSGSVAEAVTTHHLDGALGRGQERAVDIELHPGIVPDRGLDGELELYDGERALGVSMRLTVATTPGVESVLAGRDGGPLPPAAFDLAVAALTSGDESPRKLARRITGAEGSRGSWLPWRRRGGE